MKLIAVKRISSQLPKGATFEASGMKARVLIAIKAAKPAPDDAPAQEAAVVPVVPSDEPAPAPRFTSRRSTRSEAPRA